MKLIDLRGEVSCYNIKWWRRRWINNTNKHSVAYPLFSKELKKKLSHTDINYRKQDNHYSQRIQEQMIFASATFSTIRMLLIIKETTFVLVYCLCDIYDRLLICIHFRTCQSLIHEVLIYLLNIKWFAKRTIDSL